MNINYFIKQQVTARFFVVATIASLLLSALPISYLTSQASSTGVSVNNSALSTLVDTKVNFVVSATLDNSSSTPSTYITVSDNGGNGSTFSGTTGGACNINTVDADNEFAIDKNKGVCYSNAVAGVYTLTIQLFDESDSAVGEPATVVVTVENPVATTTKMAELKLLKQVVGGQATSGQWSLSASAEGNEFNFNDSSDPQYANFHEVEAEVAYTLGESEYLSDSYSLTDIECDGGSLVGNTITLAEGDEVTCTLTNTYEEDPIEINIGIISVCKFDVFENEIAGWEMTITNDKEGEWEVSTTTVTGEDGCVSVEVDPEDGPFYVNESEREGWNLVEIYVQGYGDFTEDEMGCSFFTPIDQYAETADLVSETSDDFEGNICIFVNEEVEIDEPCVDTTNSGATGVATSTQTKKKDGSDITDINRTNPDATLAASDWTDGEETGFFSLGFGGSVTLEFDNYVNEVVGTDLKIYEATNGVYPTETAIVEVSQNGTTWYQVGAASNPAPDRITEIDFSSTTLPWIKFVKITDSTDQALHNNDADGFDVDAVVATKTTCKEPKPVVEEPTGACEIEGHKYDDKGNPLEGWFIGLKKFVMFGEVEEQHTILNDTTDETGYYCLEWDNVDFSEVEPGYDSFLYRIFEKLQEGWKFISIEEGADYENLNVVEEEDIWYGEGEVGTQFGEVNGYILADKAYHVDFYNQFATSSATSTDEVPEEVSTSTSQNRGGGGGGTRVQKTVAPTPLVAGVSDSNPSDGQVLGDQVSVVPYGAAGAGAGGTANDSVQITIATLILMFIATFSIFFSRRSNI